jgi:hypothetical protein
LNDACCALSFDEFLSPVIDQTVIVSPLSSDSIQQKFAQFPYIDQSKLVFKKDSEFNLVGWDDNWYKQQGIKFSLLDSLDSDIVIQDADVFYLKPWEFIRDGHPVFRTEDVWNDHHAVYEDAVYKLIGARRLSNESYVTEFMPYLKRDWHKLNQQLGGDWQTAIKSVASFDDTKWLSEYELLGIYKSVFDQDNYHYIKDQMPIFQHIEQLETLDWSNANVVKFKARPLKGMNEQDAHRIIDYFKRITA